MNQEGLDCNPVVFDFMTEMTWRDQPVDLDEWINQYAHRRYGRLNPLAQNAWQLLLQAEYSGKDSLISALTQRPGLEFKCPLRDLEQTVKVAQAWELLLQCAETLGATDTYRFDLVNISRQVLSSSTTVLYHRILAAYKDNNLEKLQARSQQLQALILDLDELLATRREFLLGNWLEDAKRWGDTAAERQRCEWNARNILTLWGNRDSGLHDYACKEWSGLLSSFYLPRWQKFCAALLAALQEKKPLDTAAIEHELRVWEEQWTLQNNTFPTEPQGDAIQVSRKLFTKHTPLISGLLLEK